MPEQIHWGPYKTASCCFPPEIVVRQLTANWLPAPLQTRHQTTCLAIVCLRPALFRTQKEQKTRRIPPETFLHLQGVSQKQKQPWGRLQKWIESAWECLFFLPVIWRLREVANNTPKPFTKLKGISNRVVSLFCLIVCFWRCVKKSWSFIPNRSVTAWWCLGGK